MATPSAKLAQSLEILKSLQGQGGSAIQTKSITRTHRERLLQNGFIKKVMKGWYISLLDLMKLRAKVPYDMLHSGVFVLTI